jgi:drug/metabolite transporter (DMT)-like permease
MKLSGSEQSRQLVPPGVRYMLASAFFFSLMSLQVKVVGRYLPSQEIVLARGVVSLVLAYVLVKRAGVRPWGNRRWILIVRGVLGFGALSCFYFALTRLPLAEATVLHFTNPLWTALFAALLLGEALSLWVLGPILVSLGGVVLVARPEILFGNAAASIDPLGLGSVLVGAMLASLAYVAVREASKTEHPLVIVFFFPLVAVPATLPFIPSFVWPQGWEWPLLLGVGVSTLLGQVYLTRGLSLLPAARAVTIGYTQILFVTVWGMLFFGEYLDVWGAAGSVMVVAGTLAVAVKGRASAPGAAHTEGAGRLRPLGGRVARDIGD